MFSSIQLRPLKIVCDAPRYEVVKASERVGMQSPEDVRWRRQSIANGDSAKPRTLAGRIWRLLFAFGLPEVEEKCRCGGVLRNDVPSVCAPRSGGEIHYALAQCGRCRSIVWDDGQK